MKLICDSRLAQMPRRANPGTTLGEKMASAFVTYAAGDALRCRVRERSQDVFAVDGTRCRYAEFYKELGAPELGFLLVCSSDFPFGDGLGADIKLTRTQTIMQGASHCDFRYRRIDPKGEA